jgi:xanthine dehydrogenase accessory factor
MWDWVSKLQELKGQNFALVTLISCRGSTPREVGAKMIVMPDGQFFGTIGGGQLEMKLIAESVVCIKKRESQYLHVELCPKTGQCCGGIVDAFVDVMLEQPKLYLFGAGHVGKAITKTLEGTAFEVHLIDERPEWIDSTDIPQSVNRHYNGWRQFVDQVNWDDKRTYVAVMTHSHEMDQEIIEEVTKRQARYIGLIGSDSKWRRFKSQLETKGHPSKLLNRVKCPIGLPIGGKAPQELAISVASELLKLHHESAK